MHHDIHVLLLPERDEIPFSSIKVAADIDSWSRELTATLIGHKVIDLLSSRQNPIIELWVSGEPWEFVLDDWEQTEAFGNVAVSVSGLSRSVLLSSKYYWPRDQVSTSVATAQQLANAELPLAEWSLDWRAVDWPIAAGAWSYQGGTPVSAISTLSEAAGSALLSARTGQALIVQPRFPTPPWAFDDAPADYLVPLSAVENITRRNVPLGEANAVFVRGGTGGILAHVTRAGTPGDRELTMRVNPLNTDPICSKAIGEVALAEAYPPPSVGRITIPLSKPEGEFPLIEIGTLVGVVDRSKDVKGIAVSSFITVDVLQDRSIKVRQTVALSGGKSTNPYSRLQSLTNRQPLLVGTVVSQGTDTVNVELPGGGTIAARGTAINGETVYLRNGVIESTGVSMPVVPISV